MKPRAQRIAERDVEEYLCKRVESMGGVAEKFTSPNRRSVPDRLVQWPGVQMTLSVVGAKVHFVECKAPGEKPTVQQGRDHERRRAMGFVVVVVDSFESVESYLEVYGP